MNTKTAWTLLVLALLAGGLGLTRFTSAEAGERHVETRAALEGEAVPAMTMYKSPTCTCCTAWGDHFRENGYEVREEISDNVVALMDQHGVPAHLRSCHFGVLGEYVLVGHVPAEVAARLLEEKPAVTGIAVPGMPIGSPGMEHLGRKDRYDVIAFAAGGAEYVFETR